MATLIGILLSIGIICLVAAAILGLFPIAIVIFGVILLLGLLFPFIACFQLGKKAGKRRKEEND